MDQPVPIWQLYDDVYGCLRDRGAMDRLRDMVARRACIRDTYRLDDSEVIELARRWLNEKDTFVSKKSLPGGQQAGKAGAKTLKDKIAAGKIIFDSANEATLKAQLLRENTGTQVTANLQSLVLELSKLVSSHIRISSLVRGSGHHGTGRAVDIGNENIAGSLLPKVAKSAQVAALKIDELIFDAGVAGESDRNKWNYDQGKKHNYDDATLKQHKNHIHFSVKA